MYTEFSWENTMENEHFDDDENNIKMDLGHKSWNYETYEERIQRETLKLVGFALFTTGLVLERIAKSYMVFRMQLIPDSSNNLQ